METDENTVFFFDRKVSVFGVIYGRAKDTESLWNIAQLATLKQLGFSGAALELLGDAVESVEMHVAKPGDIREEFNATVIAIGKAGQMSSVGTRWKVEGEMFTRVALP